MLRYIVIIFSFFSILFLGATNIGPVTIRNICIAGLFVFLLVTRKNISIDICGKIYCIYLAILLLSNIISGQLYNPIFLKNFITNHISSIVLLMAIPLIIKSIIDIKIITGFVVAVHIFNCAISILQFYNVPIGWHIGLAVNPGAISNLDSAEYYIQQSDNFMSRSIVFGITSFVVANGYYLTSFLPITTRHLLFSDAGSKDKIISWCLLVLSAITIFMVQQRMAFFLLLCYIVFVLYMQIRESLLSKLILLIIAVASIGLYTFPTDIEVGRLTLDEVGSDTRMNQTTNIINFMNTDSFIWGADLNDKTLLYSLGHNTLTDALRRGGFILLIFYLPLFIAILCKCIYTGIVSQKINAPYSLAFSVSCVIFLAYSFSHSTGIQSGAVLFWFSYALMISSWKYEKNNLSD